MATRAASGKVLNHLAERLPGLIGGSADLAPSNKTMIAAAAEFSATEPAGRNLHFGVREHAMGAIANGIALHGGLIPYCGTFLVFSDYMRPAARVAALTELQVVYIWTHDSIGVGEDGPTHQPIEHLAALRAIPNCAVIRPADACETAEAWRAAMRNRKGPTALALTRQNLPVLDQQRYGKAQGLHRGAYVLLDPPNNMPVVLLLATGSEVSLALDAAELLAADRIPARVVSMPCWEFFEKQPQSYRDEVLPPGITARVAIEAGVSLGWHRWVGDHGAIVAIDRFGASAPAQTIFEKFGLTAERVAESARQVLKRD